LGSDDALQLLIIAGVTSKGTSIGVMCSPGADIAGTKS